MLGESRLDDGIYSTCTAANGTLYVATMSTLYAIERSE
ncbi:MAG: PQQ-binding-like beta-propeller repeat protein [Thermoguttaceae bacterium]